MARYVMKVEKLTIVDDSRNEVVASFDGGNVTIKEANADHIQALSELLCTMAGYTDNQIGIFNEDCELIHEIELQFS